MDGGVELDLVGIVAVGVDFLVIQSERLKSGIIHFTPRNFNEKKCLNHKIYVLNVSEVMNKKIIC